MVHSFWYYFAKLIKLYLKKQLSIHPSQHHLFQILPQFVSEDTSTDLITVCRMTAVVADFSLRNGFDVGHCFMLSF